MYVVYIVLVFGRHNTSFFVSSNCLIQVMDTQQLKFWFRVKETLFLFNINLITNRKFQQ